VLYAFSDPIRLDIVRQLAVGDSLACGNLASLRLAAREPPF
jgi:hypothetical protein